MFKKSFIKSIEVFRMDVILAIAVLIVNFVIFNGTTSSPEVFPAFIPSIIGCSLVLLAFPLFFKTGLRSLFVIIVLLLVPALQFADTLFFRYFTDVLSIGILGQTAVLGSVKSSLMTLLHPQDFLLFGGAVLLMVIYGIYFAFKRQTKSQKASKETSNDTSKNASKNASKKPRLKVQIIIGIMALLIGFGSSYRGLNLLLANQPGILKSFYDRVYITQNLGFVNYHVLDAYRFLTSLKKTPVTETDIQNIAKFAKVKALERENGKYLKGKGKGKNLIVIQTEALQGFVIGAKIDGQLVAPNLTKLAGGSQYFDNYYVETAGGGTSDAEFLANTSLFPVKEGAAYIRFSGNNFITMPELLKDQGYSTSAMHSFKAGFWNRSIMYKTMGFDKFYNKNDMVQDEISGMGLTDKSFFKQMMPKLKEAKQPYYSLMITLTSHFPYDNDKKYFDPNFKVGKWKGTMMGDYLTTIHYADAAIGEFIDQLKKEGMLDNTVLALYGDHYAIPEDKQDELFSFLNLGKKSSYKWNVNQTIPMMIRVPDVKPKTWHIVGGGVDFMPTIMNIMGVSTPNAPMLGRDLMNSKTGFAIMRHGTFRNDDVLFNISESKAYQVPSGKELDYSKYTKQIDYAERSLEYSDIMIENDLVMKVAEAMKNLK